MNLYDFIRNSSLPKMQVNSLYFKPDIPQDILANAIREYAPEVGMSKVNVLLDESFWGNGKEGMLITNDKIFLSGKFGNKAISLNAISQLHINDKNLIVNDLPITKFKKPELMPLIALGSKLNDFIATSKKAKTEQQCDSLLDDSVVGKLARFLSRFTEPLYFKSTPAERRTPNSNGYVLPISITEEQEKFIRFKGGLFSNEVILCTSWLDINDNKDEFFCITNRGIYSVVSSKAVIFISHNEIQSLEAIEEYKESRYVALRLSNEQCVIVSNQNAFIRPYAYELFTGLISILKGEKPKDRTDNDISDKKENTLLNTDGVESKETKKPMFTNVSHQNKFDTLHCNSLLKLKNELDGDCMFLDELIDQQMKIILAQQLDFKSFIKNDPTKSKLEAEVEAESAELGVLLFLTMHFYSLSKIQDDFKKGMGDSFRILHTFSMIYAYSFKSDFQSVYHRQMNLDDDTLHLIPMIFFNKDQEGSFDLKIPREEALLMLLEKLGLPKLTAQNSISKFDRAVDEWLKKIMSKMIREDSLK